MRTATTTLLIVLAFASLWAQAPSDGTAKGKGKGKGDAKAAIVPPAPLAIPQVLRLLRPSTYLVTGHGSNSVFRVTPKGVLVVDTKLAGPNDFERLSELIRGITPQPVKFVFNSSAKPESSGNNTKFQAAGAEIIVGERTVKLDITDVRSIRFGETTAVYFPADKLICLGDLL